MGWEQFYGLPDMYIGDWTLYYMIRCECTHFFCSAYMGFVVAYLLMRTISYLDLWDGQDRYIFQFCFWWGLFVAILVHVTIDAFTGLA